MVGRSSDSPAIDNQARYVTEGDTVSAKPIKKEKGDVSGAVKTPDTSHVRHIDKSIAIPPGVADFKEWGQTVIVMDKYADRNWSFSELKGKGRGRRRKSKGNRRRVERRKGRGEWEGEGRPPNCYIQFKLCACGRVHGYLKSLIDLDAATPLYVADRPVDH